MAKRPTNDLAAGKMAERGQTFGQPDQRFESPKTEMRYPKDEIKGLIDKIPSPDNSYPSILNNVKGILHGANNVLAATDTAWRGEEFDETEFVEGVAELGLGASRLNTLAAGAGGAALNTVSMFGARAANRAIRPTRVKGNTPFTAVNEDIAKLKEFEKNSWNPDYADMSPIDFEQARLRETGFIENPTLRVRPGWVPEEDRYLKWIPDEDLKFSQNNDFRGLSNRLDENNPTLDMKLADWVDHPELYNAYPELKDMPVTIARTALPGQEDYQAMYDPAKKAISINLGNINAEMADRFGVDRFNDVWNDPELEQGINERILSILMHEVQHGVQDLDASAGFKVGRGSNMELAFSDALQRLTDIDHILRADTSGMTYKEMKLHNDMKIAFMTMQDVFSNVTGRSGEDFITIMRDVASNTSFAGKKMAHTSGFMKQGILPEERKRYINDAAYALYRKDLGEAQATMVEGNVNSGSRTPWLDEEVIYDPNRPHTLQPLVTND